MVDFKSTVCRMKFKIGSEIRIGIKSLLDSLTMYCSVRIGEIHSYKWLLPALHFANIMMQGGLALHLHPSGWSGRVGHNWASHVVRCKSQVIVRLPIAMHAPLFSSKDTIIWACTRWPHGTAVAYNWNRHYGSLAHARWRRQIKAAPPSSQRCYWSVGYYYY